KLGCRKFVYKLFFLLGLVYATTCDTALAQAGERPASPPDHDTSYYISLADHIMTRAYMSRKYTSVRLGAPRGTDDIHYLPNTTLNMGVGATYKSLTLNLAYGFPFLNRRDERGKTKYLDLQSHIYTRKWTYDI